MTAFLLQFSALCYKYPYVKHYINFYVAKKYKHLMHYCVNHLTNCHIKGIDFMKNLLFTKQMFFRGLLNCVGR